MHTIIMDSILYILRESVRGREWGGAACNDANAIPTRSQYAGTYAAAIPGRYGAISWMGGAGRSGDGLRMVSRVSVGGAGRSGDGLRMVSRINL